MTTPATSYMSCPRECGVDVRDHNSSDLIDGQCDTGAESTGYQYNEHANQLGDWCPWSEQPADEDDDACPAGCPASAVEETDEEPEEPEEPEEQQCERCRVVIQVERDEVTREATNFDTVTGLCDDCSDYNALRVV